MPEIVRVRTEPAEDNRHDHVTLVGYHTAHIATEPIMISIERARSFMVFERLYLKTPDGEADLVEGKCSVCGHEPYLRTSADGEKEEKLQALEQG